MNTTQLHQTISTFLDHQLGKGRSPATIRAYRTDLHQFVSYIEETDISVSTPLHVTRTHVNEYLSHLARNGTSGVSRARKLAAIREYFRYLVDSELLPRSPVAGIETPKKEHNNRNHLRNDEYTKILSLAGGNPRDYAIFQIFLQTGVRVSELCFLTIEDVDLTAGQLHVREGKGQSAREIVLEKKAILAVKRYLQVRPDALSDVLFLNRYGEPLGDRGVRKLVAKYTKDAGITKKISPHSFRHTFATSKAESGKVSPFQLQQWLGHRNLNTTQIYVHMAKQNQRKVMKATSL